MPLSAFASTNVLQWVDSIRTVGVLQSVGQTGTPVEVVGGSYARQPVSFGPLADGARHSTTVLTYAIPSGQTVAWYSLYDASSVLTAIMPHSIAADNTPQICMFLDTLTGWIEAPDHTLVIGQEVVFWSGPTPGTNTFATAIVDPINNAAGHSFNATNSLPQDVAASFGPYWLWFVTEVAAHRFRMKLNESFPTAYVPFSQGWGYYQKVTQSPFPQGGTLSIASISIAEYG